MQKTFNTPIISQSTEKTTLFRHFLKFIFLYINSRRRNVFDAPARGISPLRQRNRRRSRSRHRSGRSSNGCVGRWRNAEVPFPIPRGRRYLPFPCSAAWEDMPAPRRIEYARIVFLIPQYHRVEASLIPYVKSIRSLLLNQLFQCFP